MKDLEDILWIILGLVGIVIIILVIIVFFQYKDTPTKDLPVWVWWLLK